MPFWDLFPWLVDIWASLLAAVLFTAGIIELMIGPLKSTHFFGFEWANERESRLSPGIAGRNIAMGPAMPAFNYNDNRQALGTAMLYWSATGISDRCAVWVYDGKKIGIHAFNTSMVITVGSILLAYS